MSRSALMAHMQFLFVLCLLFAGAAEAAPDPLANIQLPGKNYANNGGFERNTEGWTYFSQREFASVVTDEKHSGQSCLRVTGMLNDYRYLNQTPVYLVPGKTYTLSAWMKCTGFKRAGENTQLLNLTNYGWTHAVQLGPLKPDEDWAHYEVTFEAPPTEEVGGRPSYTLVVFWPINSEGTVWIDDVQIEEGKVATDFTENYLGWGIETLENLRRAYTKAAGTRASLAEGLGGLQVPAPLLERVDRALKSVDAIADKLRRYSQLPLAEAQALPQEEKALSGEVNSLGTLTFLSDPYRPLTEVALPATQPDALDVSWTCLQREKRTIALTVANLTEQTAVTRVVPGDLYDVGRQVCLPYTPWLTSYYAPALRGHLKPWERYTDPLPQLGDSGVWTLGGGQVNQAVLVCDTSLLLPGEYRGEVQITSLSEQIPPQKLTISLKVIPVTLGDLRGKQVCDIGSMADYALDSIKPLGFNTFTITPQWLMPEYDPTGKGVMTVDFTRISPLVQARLRECPKAQFWLGFGAGDAISAHLKQVYGIAAGDSRFAQYLTRWMHSVVKGFAELNVGPERLIIETIDEPGPGQLAEAARIARIIKAAEPKVRTQAFVTSFEAKAPASQALYATHDIIAPGFTSINDDCVAYLRKLGKQVWVYDCQNNAETFHPVTYYRLLPWLAWRYELDGWGHFSILNSERDRNYEPWEGVAEEAIVYPDVQGGQVISRRWLALEAGTQDFRALQSLERLATSAKQAGVAPEAVQRAEKLLKETAAEALALAKPGREYFTGLQPGADPAIIDHYREEIASLAGQIAEVLKPAPLNVNASGGAKMTVTLPRSDEVTIRYLQGYHGPWKVLRQVVAQGRTELPLPADLTRGFVSVTAPNGLISVANLRPMLRISVDSTMPPYQAERLNDGLAMPGMKFEPEWGWISNAAAQDHWVEAKLDMAMSLRGVKVWWMTFYGLPLAIKLQVWQNGAWQDAPGYEKWRPAKSAVEELTCPPVKTDRVRVVQQANGGNKAFPTLMGMSEIEILPVLAVPHSN